MYYAAVSAAGEMCVCAAETEGEGINEGWAKGGKVDLPGDSPGGPNLIRMPDGTERMYYHTTGEDGERRIEAAERREGGEWKVIAKSINLPDI
jgi:hypothetical protein